MIQLSLHSFFIPILTASMLAGAEAGADIVDGAIDAMSGLSSQPCLGALVAALGEKNNVDLDALQVLNEYWESVRNQYNPFEVQGLSAAIGSSVYKRKWCCCYLKVCEI